MQVYTKPVYFVHELSDRHFNINDERNGHGQNITKFKQLICVQTVCKLCEFAICWHAVGKLFEISYWLTFER